MTLENKTNYDLVMMIINTNNPAQKNEAWQPNN